MTTAPPPSTRRGESARPYFNEKTAETERSAVSFSLQFTFVPAQSPDQPVNLEPAAGLAFRVTDAPTWNVALQVVPQLIPAGLDVTLPVPFPDLLTVSVARTSWKFAVTE